MKQTVVGVFDQYIDAQQAARILEDKGFDHDHVHVAGTGDGAAATRSADRSGDHQDEGVMAGIRHFFSDLFGPDDHQEVGTYAEAVRRGGAVVKVEVDEDDELERARDLLQQAGAVDIDERAEEWRAAGWNPSAGYESDGNGRTGWDTSRAQGVSDGRSEGAIPVVREELNVGKRSATTGGVRVYSRVVESPVEESVELRSEHVDVQRRPVDRPVSSADIDALQDKTIEVRETSEKPVVEKRARVVEEVSVDKDVQTRTETVRDTVRNTEVEVEQLGASDTGMRSGRDYADYDSDFRRDFQSNYAASGAQYDDYEPAYRYGHSLAADPRYRGRDWNDIEPHARSDWEQRNPGSGWERFKASVRHAWERARH